MRSHAWRPGQDALKLTPELLKTFAPFKTLGDGVLAAIAAECSVQHYGDGELVIGHTDTSFDVLLLVSGAARVSLYSADGQRVGFIELPHGMMFGEISAIDGLPRSASVEASEASIIARLPQRRFLALMEENPAFAIAVARQLAGHVRRLTTRVFEFSTMAVRQRLRAELLRLAKPAAGADTAAIASLPTHAELASRISTHREAVSRELAWLGDGGFIVKQGRSLLIPSLGKFRSLMEDGWEG
jgi:CRP-like cAMP-binding protein